MTKRERLDSIATSGDLFPELTDKQKKANDYIVRLVATIHRLCRRNRKTETTIASNYHATTDYGGETNQRL